MHIFTLCDCTDNDQSECRVFAVFITRVLLVKFNVSIVYRRRQQLKIPKADIILTNKISGSIELSIVS